MGDVELDLTRKDPDSVLRRRWKLLPGVDGDGEPVVLSDGTRVPEDFAALIRSRGVRDVASYLEPSLRNSMPDPDTLKGMKEGVSLFCAAIRGGRKVALFGDYDADGATSTATVLRYLRAVGCRDAIFHIPQRLTEGYGPNKGAIAGLADDGARLLVILDSGTTAFDEVAFARSLGLDVLIVDHHEPVETGRLPDAVVINPKTADQDGSLDHLCTAGLAMLFLVAVNRRLRVDGFFSETGISEPNLSDLMGLTALGTVADVVPLKGLNRAYVAVGLRRMDRITGLDALIGATRGNRESKFTSRACGFVLGPCINAAGRISDTMQGTRLLSTDDPAEADRMAVRLVELNEERKNIQERMVAQCIEAVGAPSPSSRIIVVHDPSWHPGVVGLGASKIRDRFDRSSVVVGQGGKGSGRSVEGFNIGRAFIKARENGLILKGGGHAAAGGLTIDPAMLERFRAFMEEEAADFEPEPTPVDMRMDVGGMTIAFAELIRMMEPTGKGNELPAIAVTGGVLTEVRRLDDRRTGEPLHVSGTLQGNGRSMRLFLPRGVGTNLGETLLSSRGRLVDILGTVSINDFNSRRTVQIQPVDAIVHYLACPVPSEAENAPRVVARDVPLPF